MRQQERRIVMLRRQRQDRQQKQPLISLPSITTMVWLWWYGIIAALVLVSCANCVRLVDAQGTVTSSNGLYNTNNNNNNSNNSNNNNNDNNSNNNNEVCYICFYGFQPTELTTKVIDPVTRKATTCADLEQRGLDGYYDLADCTLAQATGFFPCACQEIVEQEPEPPTTLPPNVDTPPEQTNGGNDTAGTPQPTWSPSPSPTVQDENEDGNDNGNEDDNEDLVYSTANGTVTLTLYSLPGEMPENTIQAFERQVSLFYQEQFQYARPPVLNVTAILLQQKIMPFPHNNLVNPNSNNINNNGRVRQIRQRTLLEMEETTTTTIKKKSRSLQSSDSAVQPLQTLIQVTGLRVIQEQESLLNLDLLLRDSLQDNMDQFVDVVKDATPAINQVFLRSIESVEATSGPSFYGEEISTDSTSEETTAPIDDGPVASSSAAASSAAPPPPKSSKLSGGAIAGIVLGVVFGLLFLLFFVHQVKYLKDSAENNDDEVEKVMNHVESDDEYEDIDVLAETTNNNNKTGENFDNEGAADAGEEEDKLSSMKEMSIDDIAKKIAMFDVDSNYTYSDKASSNGDETEQTNKPIPPLIRNGGVQPDHFDSTPKTTSPETAAAAAGGLGRGSGHPPPPGGAPGRGGPPPPGGVPGRGGPPPPGWAPGRGGPPPPGWAPGRGGPPPPGWAPGRGGPPPPGGPPGAPGRGGPPPPGAVPGRGGPSSRNDPRSSWALTSVSQAAGSTATAAATVAAEQEEFSQEFDPKAHSGKCDERSSWATTSTSQALASAAAKAAAVETEKFNEEFDPKSEKSKIETTVEEEDDAEESAPTVATSSSSSAASPVPSAPSPVPSAPQQHQQPTAEPSAQSTAKQSPQSTPSTKAGQSTVQSSSAGKTAAPVPSTSGSPPATSKPSVTENALKTAAAATAAKVMKKRKEPRKVEAPPGKLGIVIDTTAEGPLLHKINPGSPLEGKLFAGDLIISIDGIETRAMSAPELTSLMVKSAGRVRVLMVAGPL